MATTVEFELKELLEKLDSKIDRMGSEIGAKIDKLDAKIDRVSSEVDAKIDRLDAKIDRVSDELTARIDRVSDELTAKIDKVDSKVDIMGADINKLDTTLKVLDTQVASAVKRIDSNEFANRAIFIGLVVAILGGLARLLGFIGKPM
jgi:outer membrane murein-binding lipoprotein Lpp